MRATVPEVTETSTHHPSPSPPAAAPGAAGIPTLPLLQYSTPADEVPRALDHVVGVSAILACMSAALLAAVPLLVLATALWEELEEGFDLWVPALLLVVVTLIVSGLLTMLAFAAGRDAYRRLRMFRHGGF